MWRVVSRKGPLVEREKPYRKACNHCSISLVKAIRSAPSSGRLRTEMAIRRGGRDFPATIARNTRFSLFLAVARLSMTVETETPIWARGAGNERIKR